MRKAEGKKKLAEEKKKHVIERRAKARKRYITKKVLELGAEEFKKEKSVDQQLRRWRQAAVA